MVLFDLNWALYTPVAALADDSKKQDPLLQMTYIMVEKVPTIEKTLTMT